MRLGDEGAKRSLKSKGVYVDKILPDSSYITCRNNHITKLLRCSLCGNFRD